MKLKRSPLTTSLDPDLLLYLRVYAASRSIEFNKVLEEAIRQFKNENPIAHEILEVLK